MEGKEPLTSPRSNSHRVWRKTRRIVCHRSHSKRKFLEGRVNKVKGAERSGKVTAKGAMDLARKRSLVTLAIAILVTSEGQRPVCSVLKTWEGRNWRAWGEIFQLLGWEGMQPRNSSGRGTVRSVAICFAKHTFHPAIISYETHDLWSAKQGKC